jgi:hypothetical protein
MGMVRIIGVAALCVRLLGAQQPDPKLLAAINQIKAIDNHAHSGRVLAAGEHDIEIDALMSAAAPNFENYPAPVRLRPDYPENLDAWHALFGYPYRDFARAHLDELVRTKERIMREIVFIPTKGKSETSILPVTRPGRFSMAPDGKSLYIGDQGHLWKTQLPDGETEALEFRATVKLEVQDISKPVLGAAREVGSAVTILTPRLSPDGRTIVFGAAGFLWRQPVNGTKTQDSKANRPFHPTYGSLHTCARNMAKTHCNRRYGDRQSANGNFAPEPGGRGMASWNFTVELEFGWATHIGCGKRGLCSEY